MQDYFSEFLSPNQNLGTVVTAPTPTLAKVGYAAVAAAALLAAFKAGEWRGKASRKH